MAGIESAYEYWDIIHNHENTVNALSHNQVQLEKLMLNNEIVKTINTQAKNRYDKYGEDNDEIIISLLDGEQLNHVNVKDIIQKMVEMFFVVNVLNGYQKIELKLSIICILIIHF